MYEYSSYRDKVINAEKTSRSSSTIKQRQHVVNSDKCYHTECSQSVQSYLGLEASD